MQVPGPHALMKHMSHADQKLTRQFCDHEVEYNRTAGRPLDEVPINGMNGWP